MIQGYRDTGIQNTGIQGYRDTGIHGYRDTEIQGYRDTGIQEYRYAGIYRDTGIQGYSGLLRNILIKTIIKNGFLISNLITLKNVLFSGFKL